MMETDGDYQKGGQTGNKKDDVELLSRDQELVFSKEQTRNKELDAEPFQQNGETTEALN